MKSIVYFMKKMHSFAGNILYINLFGMMCVSLLNGAGLFLLFPLLSLSGVMNSSLVEKASFFQVFDFFTEIPRWIGLLMILSLFLLLMIGQGYLQRNLTLRDVKIHTGFINHIRLETYRGLLQSHWEFFIKKRKSDLINALTDDLGRVAGGTYIFLQFLSSLVFTIIQIGIALWISPSMTLFVVGCGFVILFLSRAFIKRSNRLGIQTSNLSRSYIGAITDHFNGIKDIKSNMLENSRIHWMQEWCRHITEERYQHAKLSSQSQLYFKSASAIIIALFVYVSVLVMQVQGDKLLLIILIFSRLWPRFTGIQSNLEQIAAALPALQSLMQLQKESEEEREIKGNEQAAEPVRLEMGIECYNIYFRYNLHSSKYALQNINLHIRPNEMTAIVGPSGAGKSTLVDILMGLLEPENGLVVIDGVPLTERNLLSFRKSIGYVPQDPLLFNGSIRDNLLMMEPNATEEELQSALQFAAAAEFVNKLPLGLDTHIGDRGVRLSGGERQRLVLARAILRKPSILVLDEATSALDMDNELKIQEALERLKGKMTLIIIAHRPSTIQNADQVLALDHGLLISKGRVERAQSS